MHTARTHRRAHLRCRVTFNERLERIYILFESGLRAGAYVNLRNIVCICLTVSPWSCDGVGVVSE